MRVKVVIPFRDRGLDPRRGANLEIVMAWWWARGLNPVIADDGLSGDAQFNRHRAYNRAVSGNPDTDVFVFTEADMLIPTSQINTGVKLAARRPGLVVPFTQYRYLSDSTTDLIREVYHDRGVREIALWWGRAPNDPKSIFCLTPESVMDNGRSIGAVNIVSHETLDIAGGFTEATSGNWYDDNITEEGFAFLTGNKTQFVPGPAVHLYHLPGHKGDHLSEEDRLATTRNKNLLRQLRHSIKTDNRLAVRTLMATRDLTADRENERRSK